MTELPDVDELSILKMQISDKFSCLEKCQRGISNIILKEETDELPYEEDFMKAEIYSDRFSDLCTKIERLSVKETEKKEVIEKRKFKLTKIELKKFDSIAKEYLTFWTDNYPKEIAQLQEHFGREDLFGQINVRDLLSMVMRNAATGRSKTDLPALYDELEAKIRALESLGWTQDKYGELWSPLLESCLPEDILLTFERSKNFKEDTPGEGRTVKLLMNFLKQEVKNDEMVEFARNNFSAPVNQKKKEVNKPDKFPSAATLVSTHDRNGTGFVKDEMKKRMTYKPSVQIRTTCQGDVLSDLENEDSEIDILIGANVAGLLFIDGCIELQLGLFLLRTRLDYVLTGRQGVFETCLNLIEQVPDILDRLRRYPIGLSTDIKKAFLQLGITPKHGDFLLFFYPDEGEEIVYRRHYRVVFGISSSPFLSNTSQGMEVALIRAKARVAPLKQVTIPRYELMACCIGSRLAHSVQESLNITEMETVFGVIQWWHCIA
ncbi:DUF1758 domain-containing protein [Trichonephila clavipes]|nr:DUF1758 domain-containing protein [Trichonephila clavipes]